MTLLSYHKKELLSSDYIASSIHINPAVIRKEISHLREHGLVESKEGKGGGSALSKAAKDIKLSDIYQAVRQAPLLGRTNDPNPSCPVGRQINKHLDKIYSVAEEALVKQLEKVSLADFTKQFR